MKIIRLESENIKRLHAVEIKPDGSLIIIGGKNAQGKTSVLDSIEYALGGTSSIPSKPIRKGERKARIVVELDNIIVTRTFGESGSKLVVSDKEGFTKSSPQALLDSLVGKLSFDPLAFIGMKPDEQLKIVKELAGIDFSELDKETKKIYDDRMMVNREIKSLQAQVQAIIKHEGVSEEETLVSELVKQLGEKTGINQQNQKEWDHLDEINKAIPNHQKYLNQLKEEISVLRRKWDNAVLEEKRLEFELNNQIERMKTVKDEDTDTVRIQISQAEETNQKIRSNNKRNELLFDLELRQQNSEKITKRLDEIEDEKLKLISSSKLPITGLAFDSSTLYYNDVPFADQSSSAEQLRVSVAMGFAMNPKLKTLLVRDGSLLDKDSKKMVREMAEEAGGQVWMEVTTEEAKECQVIIEDGRVKE